MAIGGALCPSDRADHRSMEKKATYQCRLSVPTSEACQCQSVPPISASSSVPISATYQCPFVQ
ncbi:unnamed protein product, partial [Staurois parvus]